MKNPCFPVMATFAFLSFVATATAADSVSVQSAVSLSTSASWSDRSRALTTLEATVEAAAEAGRSAPSEVATALIAQLRLEAAAVATGKNDHTEFYSEYFSSLIGAVAALRDARAAPVLSSPSVIATGDIAIDGLARLGHPAVSMIVSAFAAGGEEPVRTALTLSASKIMSLEAGGLESDRAKLTSLLIAAAHDKSPFVRESAIRGLISSRSEAGRNLVSSISESDPYRVERNGNDFYPVRDSARLALQN